MAEESGLNPNSEEERPSSLPSARAPNPRVPQRFNLLVAEDNLPDAVLVRQAIRAENLPFDVHIASDGQEAIDFIRRVESDPEAPSPHLLLLDLNLPKKNGFEVLRWLRESSRFKEIPVIVMTSSNSVADKNRAAELGAGYFRKPPDYDEFMKLGDVLKEILKGPQTKT
jgi:DNA-binding response OmpR family regulator